MGMFNGYKVMQQLILLVASIIIFNGCTGTSKMNLGNQLAINVDNISRIEKEKTTKKEIVELFGTPAFDMYSPVYDIEDNNLLVYKKCEVVAKATSIPIVLNTTSKGRTICEILTIKFTQDNIVDTFSYHNGDVVTEENIAKIEKEKTTINEILELFGAPGKINRITGDKMFVYEECVNTFNFSFAGTESNNKCKQLSVLFNKFDVVETYSYQNNMN